MEDNKKLATHLHATLCKYNHIDICSWMYEKDWTRGAKKEYLDKANKLLKLTDYNTLIKILEELK